MKIQPLEKNIKSLIGDQDSYFSIPDYQRPYRWGKENIDDFWNDITTAYDNNEENYFLGSMILIKKQDNNDFELVDGQQRLTTITIFLAVLRDYFAEHGRAGLSEKIHDEFICKDGKFRLQIRPEDRSDFENYVLKKIGALRDIKNTSLALHYINAIQYLQENINNKESELVNNEKDAIHYLESLYNYFMDKTLVVNIIAEDLSSAYTIFETINQRGEGLETDELLKNFLLKRLQEEIKKHNRLNPKSEKDFEIEKQVLLEGYKYIKGIAGEDIEMQELLRHHWTAMIGVKPKKNLYKEIINYIKSKNLLSEDFIREWKSSADCYASLIKGKKFDELSNEAKNNLKLLWYINHWEWLPVLISARRNNYSKSDFEELIFALEKMYALFWIAGYNVAKIKNPTLALIRDYVNKNKSIAEIKEYIDDTIRRSGVLMRFMDSIQGDCYGQSWCRYALSKYEYLLTDDSVEKSIDFNCTQIEHILPQTMTAKYWTDRFTVGEQLKLVNTIGNLTLLIGGVKEKNKSKNQTASNKPYDEKLKIYSGETLKDRQSAFNMTQELSKYKEWTPLAIKERQKSIIDKLKEVWQITDGDIKNEEVISIAEESDNNENEFTEEELTLIDQYKLNLEEKMKTKFLDRADDVDVEEKTTAWGRCKEDYYNFYGSKELYGDDKYAEKTYVPCIYFSKSTYFLKELAIILHIQVMDNRYASVINFIRDKREFSDWTYNDRYSLLFKKVDFNNTKSIEDDLAKAYIMLLEIKDDHSSDEFENERNTFSLDRGNYSDKELEGLLQETLSRDTTLTPRLIKFLEILLSESRTFSREEIKGKLFQKGVGDDDGQAGRYLSNISQFITKRDSDHLRQIVSFKTDGGIGELKDDYCIVDKYREIVKEVLDRHN
ncbi:MAG: DUF262 domain-containing HNH endonuclease family protein [Patescibacteria group bacterium]